MQKFKIEQRNGQISISTKLEKMQDINSREFQLFQQKIIRGLMRFSFDGNNKLTFSAQGNVSLRDFLHKGININEFFVVFTQIVEVLKKIEYNNLNFNNLVLDLDYIFINDYTKDLNLIYMPIINSNASNNVFTLIYDIINNVTPSPNTDVRYLNELMTFVRTTRVFSTKNMEEYITRVYPQVYNQINKYTPGQSQMLNNKRVEPSFAPAVASGTGVSAANPSTSGTPAYNRMNSYEALANDDEATGLLYDEADEEATGLLFEPSEETTVLEDNTTLYNNQNVKNFPYLLRLNNYERVEVNKPSFRIGKERSYVDYFVSNNSAVSRIHADIITKDNRYFIRDNNSTNRTFVNGTPIPVSQDIEIFDGDAIMLANEPFEFHLDI